MASLWMLDAAEETPPSADLTNENIWQRMSIFTDKEIEDLRETFKAFDVNEDVSGACCRPCIITGSL